MKPIGISVLTICGIDELTSHGSRSVTDVLSLLDPGWPDITTFADYGTHRRTILNFHDIIDPAEGKIVPTKAHVGEILDFGARLTAEQEALSDRHLLVHCHMGISRSTAAMLSLLAQLHADEPEDRLFERLRHIRPQAWPNSLMVGFADDILGRDGRLVAALCRHYGVQMRERPEFVDWMRRLDRSRELDMAV